jgi:hypothetical protein
MTEGRPCCVVTTVQDPTPSVRRLAEVLAHHDIQLLIIGDRKGPSSYDVADCTLLTIDDQSSLGSRLASRLPENHYVRKNLGYLVAIRNAAPFIYETDDDNAPLEGWSMRTAAVNAEPIQAREWANVYRIFDPESVIWPRGYPLELVRDHETFSHESAEPVRVIAPVQQGLADGSPDVDAVWRLVSDAHHEFSRRPSLWLPPGTWCPFNSQSTWWWPEAYPLLYLPAFCSFRMTDIWRSFVAQRCLWAMGHGMVFHAAEVFQERNTHNLLRDFEDEIPGYLGNIRLCETLAATELDSHPESTGLNLNKCYEALVSAGFFPSTELDLVESWLEDLAETGLV